MKPSISLVSQLSTLALAMADYKSIELRVEHHFSHGTYTRELLAPAGTIAIGKVHRHSTTNIILSGRLQLITSDGVAEEMQGPAVFVTEAGVQKAVKVLEDARILNVHPWDGKMNLEELEKELIISQEELTWRG